MTMTNQQFVDEVGEWGKRNFDTCQNPWLGMVEEVGEIAHCLLKRQQKIRGFDQEAFFKAQLEDALGDLGIYSAHFASLNGMHLYMGQEQHASIFKGGVEDNLIINELLYRLTLLHDADKKEMRQMQYSVLLRVAKTLAYGYEIDFEKAVRGTWEKIVSKRDWVAAPHTGGEEEKEINEPTSNSEYSGWIDPGVSKASSTD
jgi:NTP pyrophosphatase (non-canonical NTP hydrolase)